MEPTPTDPFFAPYENQMKVDAYWRRKAEGAQQMPPPSWQGADIPRRLNEPVRKTLRQWDAENMLALAQSQRNRLFRMVVVLAALNAAQVIWQVMR